MRTLVIAPHPDDELLGCGGTLLKRVAQGHTVGILFMTTVTTTSGWSNEQIIQRSSQITRVTSSLGIHQSDIFKLDYPTTQLDQVPLGELALRSHPLASGDVEVDGDEVEIDVAEEAERNAHFQEPHEAGRRGLEANAQRNHHRRVED